MKIGEVAERAGVSVRSLRYYEEQSLISADRTTGGQRTYNSDAVDTVNLIQMLYAAGLSSALVREVLPRCLRSGEVPPGFAARLRAERERIDDNVRKLTEVRGRLSEIIEAAEVEEA